jgi:CheY-like chemotaxis protein
MRPRILLIEDDAFLAHILTQRLQTAGMDVRHASNGEEGLRAAIQDQPEAIVLDIILPKKNGFDVLEELRAQDATKKIPVLMLTSMSSKEDIERCLELGACEYLMKTQYTASEVVERVRRHVQNGFTLIEGVIVVAVILTAGFFAYYQHRLVEARARDVERLASVRTVVSAFSAATQERLMLAGCGGKGLLSECRLCETGACRGTEDRTEHFLPGELFATDGASEPCTTKPGKDCRWSIEADSPEGVTIERFRVRFFIEKGAEGLKGPQAYVIHADGRIE